MKTASINNRELLIETAERCAKSMGRAYDMEFTVGEWGLQYDVAYGPEKRNGWCALHDGGFLCQHQTLKKAIQELRDFTGE